MNHNYYHFHPGAGHGNSLQYSCWRIPRLEEAEGLQSIEPQRVWHVWSDFSMHKPFWIIDTHRFQECSTAVDFKLGMRDKFSFIWLSYTSLKSKTRGVLSLGVFILLVYLGTEEISIVFIMNLLSTLWVGLGSEFSFSPVLHIYHANDLTRYHVGLIDIINTSDHLSKYFWRAYMLTLSPM